MGHYSGASQMGGSPPPMAKRHLHSLRTVSANWTRCTVCQKYFPTRHMIEAGRYRAYNALKKRQQVESRASHSKF